MCIVDQVTLTAPCRSKVNPLHRCSGPAVLPVKVREQGQAELSSRHVWKTAFCFSLTSVRNQILKSINVFISLKFFFLLLHSKLLYDFFFFFSISEFLLFFRTLTSSNVLKLNSAKDISLDFLIKLKVAYFALEDSTGKKAHVLYQIMPLNPVGFSLVSASLFLTCITAMIEDVIFKNQRQVELS